MKVIAMVLAFGGGFLLVELVHMSVYGRLLGKRTLDSFLEQRINHYTLNPFDDKLLSDMGGSKYFVSRNGGSIFSKWHINSLGCVPRWSKWSKRLDERREELMANGI